MKKMMAIVVIVLFSIQSYADVQLVDAVEKQDGWGWGAGLGMQSGYDQIVGIEVETPRIGRWKYSNFSLGLNVEFRDVSVVNNSVVPIHVFFESSRDFYKEVARTYARIGLGAVFVGNNTIHRDSSLFSVQLQFGLEVITFKTDSSTYGTFFSQLTYNSVSDGNGTHGMDIFDGTSILLGTRTYF